MELYSKHSVMSGGFVNDHITISNLLMSGGFVNDHITISNLLRDTYNDGKLDVATNAFQLSAVYEGGDRISNDSK